MSTYNKEEQVVAKARVRCALFEATISGIKKVIKPDTTDYNKGYNVACDLLINNLEKEFNIQAVAANKHIENGVLVHHPIEQEFATKTWLYTCEKLVQKFSTIIFGDMPEDSAEFKRGMRDCVQEVRDSTLEAYKRNAARFG